MHSNYLKIKLDLKSKRRQAERRNGSIVLTLASSHFTCVDINEVLLIFIKLRYHRENFMTINTKKMFIENLQGSYVTAEGK